MIPMDLDIALSDLKYYQEHTNDASFFTGYSTYRFINKQIVKFVAFFGCSMEISLKVLQL